ncbi:MAG: DNA repair protein RadC [Candidatus Marinimicrobia bacterium]|nr:DNA repair protein RadC [Candidatus Neomarinimicrobiota bacterium]
MKVRETGEYRMTITDWPENERPRERLMESGAFKLSDTELLAIIIRTGSGKMTAIDVAREVLNHSGGLKKLGEMDYHQIRDMKIPGIGNTKAVTIVAALQLARRLEAAENEKPDPVIKTSEDIAKIYIPKLRDLRKEIFMTLLLASNHRLIKDTIVSEGILNASVVTPREVFREALAVMAGAIILIHNHPSGSLEPSREDIQLTRQMVAVGKAMNIPVLDHVIIAGNGYLSFADKGLLHE